MGSGEDRTTIRHARSNAKQIQTLQKQTTNRKQMTDKKINEKVAALCGWKWSKKHAWWMRDRVVTTNPPYTESLDMCQDFMKEIHGGDRNDFVEIARTLERLDTLYDFEFQWAFMTLAARELCECYLKLKGQWE